MKIGILNYGLGNIGSLKNIIKKLGYDSKILNNHEDFKNIQSLIIPGVGSFDYGMNMLKKLDLIEPLKNHAIIRKKLTIGICLGMQLMLKNSEEGDLDGLGWFDEVVRKFKFKDNTFKVPHMGWNYLETKDEIFNNQFNEKRFYFVHSYYAPLNDKFELSTTTYGNQKFSSSIKRDNIYGFQFHPEKSHKYGISLLQKLLKKYEGI